MDGWSYEEKSLKLGKISNLLSYKKLFCLWLWPAKYKKIQLLQNPFSSSFTTSFPIPNFTHLATNKSEIPHPWK